MNNKDYRFFSSDDEKDRTVPPDENYYDKQYMNPDVDLDFNSRTRNGASSEIINHQNDDMNEEGYNYYTTDEMEHFGQNQNINNGSYSSKNGEARQSSTKRSNTNSSTSKNAQRASNNSQRKNNKKSKKNHSSGNSKNNRKKKSGKTKKPAKIIIIIIAIILVLVIIAGLLISPVLSKIEYDDKKEGVTSSSELYSKSYVKNILLLGVDARSSDDDESSRSDSMMLISINTSTHKIKLTSFLRDTWLYVPSYGGNQRLNAACTYGGYQGVVDAIEYNFGIKIDGYVVTDFEMFQVMVDKIGGIEVDIDESEANEVNNHPSTYGNVTLNSGTQTLTGEQALAYCRIRKVGTDWARTERQRTVMQAIISKLIKSNPITAYSTVYDVAPYIETNLSKSAIVSDVIKAVFCIIGGIETQACPFDDTWSYATINGASVISIDLDSNKEQLIDFIYGNSSDE